MVTSVVSSVNDSFDGLTIAPEADVVIIGAGLAGLCAARSLHEAGKRVVVLEARGRVGGKTLTVTSKSGGRVDVGGAWVNEHTQPEVCKLNKEAGNILFKQRVLGTTCWELSEDRQLRYYDDGGVGDNSPIPLEGEELEDYNRIFKELDRLSRTVNLENPNSTPDAVEYDSITVANWLNQMDAGQISRQALTPLVRALVGAEMHETPLFYFLHYAKTAKGFFDLIAADETGGQFQRTRYGNQTMSTWIQNHVLPPGAVKLNAAAHQIIQSPDGESVRVITRDGRQFTGRRVICAIPTPLYPNIVWQPSLPVDKTLLVQRSFLGTYTKVVLLYEKAWWLEAGFSGFALSSEWPLSLVFDTCDGWYGSDDPSLRPRQHSLSCFVVAANGVAFSELSRDRREQVVKQQVARMIGSPELVNNTIEVLEFQWIKEEFSQGAPCPVTATGAFTLYGDSLARPHGLVHFAGSELSDVWKGYMEGAIISGRNTAKEVLEFL
ncbi:monoamine oxidase [Cryptococcus deuterogattii 99/473]|uniref:Amine oxidase n=2 Tax=Cryptococcus deuterogattii TaxID=1859096 RepID=A0A0D0TTG2_9TREE|nr:monoamine oxidase [Cryptococcus deuterogattii R265]KIR26732.1 monoamine oxidase [Cryptococcus deuterogattii LA55]KIR36605.1 monoamine oxidase [Cryptococcus deuterogattii MMRL2647]KIR39008.1 monoamine oxidase [Cryptococcus deuterogattii Ram5]KIR76034.1 monoamine oxidase [Cryptococcus deuterogattii CA1014]KIR95978.1 monoamine oxidase [Cryptococcus deuterogattii CBS 10090]KIS02474.1 monoamine oxidase [Cryptococcus deuterogattii 2001/935-1]KIY58921.1 monoamine oxidase [Cryptococcus deuterogat